MKKIYLSALALLTAGAINAQGFWNAVSYKGAFPVTDGMTGIGSNDWTAGWTNFSPETTNYPATNVTVSSDITVNTTWTTGQVVLLQNKVFVKNGATLTIQPGVIVRGDNATQGTLIITRGSKIVAQGTQQSPIVFTSNYAAGAQAPGDWGGVLILGNGIINQPGGVANIEGLTVSTDTEYGGSNNNDSSGVFSYCRIEFSGIALQPNKETNGLTLGAVGSKTKLDHIQISFGGDDGFEWFGGKTWSKYLISFRTLDDDFDSDFGATGGVQFGLIIRDSNLSDAAGDSNGFESDNEANSPYASLPLTSLQFSNITSMGPLRNNTVTLPGAEKFERAIYTRRNTAIGIYNSLFSSWEKGWRVKDLGTYDNFLNDSSRFENNVLAFDMPKKFETDAASNATPTFYSTYAALMSVDTVTTIAQINWVNGLPAALNTTPDYRLNPTSTVATGASFSAPVFAGNIVGINNNTALVSSFNVYPNPATNNVKVAINLNKDEVISVAVYDVTGKLVAQLANNERMNSGATTLNMSTSSLSSGMYFVKVSSENINNTIKLIINK